MESKWYFFPGQTVENTKISDRAHALHITDTAWNNITQHLDRKKRIQEAIDKELAHKKALKDGSDAMTKEWKDSIKNIRLRKEQERLDRLGQKKDDRIQLFYQMKAEQEVIRKEFVEKVKKQIFQSTGYPKELTSALILSETLYERDKQKEFNETIKQRKKEINKQFADLIIARDAQEKQEDKEEKQKKLEISKKVAQTLRQQIEENETAFKNENRLHIEKETQERIKAAKEEELIKQFEHEEKERLRRQIQKEKLRDIQDERIRQQRLKKEEEEFEKAVEFYSTAKHRIECMKKSKEKAMRSEALAKREEIASRVAAIKMDNEKIENERIAKVVAEREAAEAEKVKAKLEFAAKARQERIDDRKHYLERQENEKHIEEEMKRWEMLNRIKTAEVIQDYNEQIRKEKWKKILEYRRELKEQMAEELQIRKDEKEIDEIMSKVSFEEADKMFFEYANEVLEYAKSKNRQTYPIEKVIMEYKKVNSLLPRESRIRKCQKHT